MSVITFGALCIISLFLTCVIRFFAGNYALLDVPNERSSHERPTPRGGGLAVVLVIAAGIVWKHDAIAAELLWALGAAILVALISLVDDLRPLSARVRLAVQALSAALALIALGGIDAVNLGFMTLEGWWLNGFAWLFILWMTNLYNFLDGIDGYAGSEALFAGLAGYWLFGSEPGLLIAAAAAGFLLFNWHKASIFMGDVGSAPLGFLFAVLALHDAASPAFLGWIVLLSLFWFDATVTLWRRWRNGERLSQAHRKHAYQRLHQAGWPHDRIVLAGMGVNLLPALLLWLVAPAGYPLVFLAAVAILWTAMKYVDRKKAFS